MTTKETQIIQLYLKGSESVPLISIFQDVLLEILLPGVDLLVVLVYAGGRHCGARNRSHLCQGRCRTRPPINLGSHLCNVSCFHPTGKQHYFMLAMRIV